MHSNGTHIMKDFFRMGAIGCCFFTAFFSPAHLSADPQKNKRDIATEEIDFYRFLRMSDKQQSNILQNYTRYKNNPHEFTDLKPEADLYRNYDRYLRGHYEDQPLHKLATLRKEKAAIEEKLKDTDHSLGLSRQEIVELKTNLTAKLHEITAQEASIQNLETKIQTATDSLEDRKEQASKVAKLLKLNNTDINDYLSGDYSKVEGSIRSVLKKKLNLLKYTEKKADSLESSLTDAAQQLGIREITTFEPQVSDYENFGNSINLAINNTLDELDLANTRSDNLGDILGDVSSQLKISEGSSTHFKREDFSETAKTVKRVLKEELLKLQKATKRVDLLSETLQSIDGTLQGTERSKDDFITSDEASIASVTNSVKEALKDKLIYLDKTEKHAGKLQDNLENLADALDVDLKGKGFTSESLDSSSQKLSKALTKSIDTNRDAETLREQLTAAAKSLGLDEFIVGTKSFEVMGAHIQSTLNHTIESLKDSEIRVGSLSVEMAKIAEELQVDATAAIFSGGNFRTVAKSMYTNLLANISALKTNQDIVAGLQIEMKNIATNVGATIDENSFTEANFVETAKSIFTTVQKRTEELSSERTRVSSLSDEMIHIADKLKIEGLSKESFTKGNFESLALDIREKLQTNITNLENANTRVEGLGTDIYQIANALKLTDISNNEIFTGGDFKEASKSIHKTLGTRLTELKESKNHSYNLEKELLNVVTALEIPSATPYKFDTDNLDESTNNIITFIREQVASGKDAQAFKQNLLNAAKELGLDESNIKDKSFEDIGSYVQAQLKATSNTLASSDTRVKELSTSLGKLAEIADIQNVSADTFETGTYGQTLLTLQSKIRETFADYKQVREHATQFNNDLNAISKELNLPVPPSFFEGNDHKFSTQLNKVFQAHKEAYTQAGTLENKLMTLGKELGLTLGHDDLGATKLDNTIERLEAQINAGEASTASVSTIGVKLGLSEGSRTEALILSAIQSNANSLTAARSIYTTLGDELASISAQLDVAGVTADLFKEEHSAGLKQKIEKVFDQRITDLKTEERKAGKLEAGLRKLAIGTSVDFNESSFTEDNIEQTAASIELALQKKIKDIQDTSSSSVGTATATSKALESQIKSFAFDLGLNVDGKEAATIGASVLNRIQTNARSLKASLSQLETISSSLDGIATTLNIDLPSDYFLIADESYVSELSDSIFEAVKDKSERYDALSTQNDKLKRSIKEAATALEIEGFDYDLSTDKGLQDGKEALSNKIESLVTQGKNISEFRVQLADAAEALGFSINFRKDSLENIGNTLITRIESNATLISDQKTKISSLAKTITAAANSLAREESGTITLVENEDGSSNIDKIIEKMQSNLTHNNNLLTGYTTQANDLKESLVSIGTAAGMTTAQIAAFQEGTVNPLEVNTAISTFKVAIQDKIERNIDALDAANARIESMIQDADTSIIMNQKTVDFHNKKNAESTVADKDLDAKRKVFQTVYSNINGGSSRRTWLGGTLPLGSKQSIEIEIKSLRDALQEPAGVEFQEALYNSSMEQALRILGLDWLKFGSTDITTRDVADTFAQDFLNLDIHDSGVENEIDKIAGLISRLTHVSYQEALSELQAAILQAKRKNKKDQGTATHSN